MNINKCLRILPINKALLVVGIISSLMISCKTNEEKSKDAVEKVEKAKENSNEVFEEIESEENKETIDSDWNTFKDDASKAIAMNSKSINDLKRNDKKKDGSFEKRLKDLEMKNKDLEDKIAVFPANNTDLKMFKENFNIDKMKLEAELKKIKNE